MILKKIYNNLRVFLPDKYKIFISKLIFKLLDKPVFVPDNSHEYKKGIIVISTDFELAWAWLRNKKGVNYLSLAKRERENFHKILNFLNEREIPITWATVGHLFLDSCKKKNGKAHAELLRPNYFENEFWKFDKGDWFDLDPCGNYKTHPEFYAPDLIELILKSYVPHEIACHSFSHIDYSEKNSYPELIESDLSACIESARKFDVNLDSFVFPGNFFGHFDLLKKYGLKVIRYKSNEIKEIGFPELLQNGLIALHDSLAFDQSEEGWDINYLLWKMKRYIDKTIEKKAICHFWFHPSINKEYLIDLFFPIIDYITLQRDQGLINVLTMKDVVKITVLEHKN